MSADTSQPSLKEVLRQKRAEYILEVAGTVLAEKGYRDASMDEIAARAGVSKGTLYQHFPTKDDLFVALIDQSLVLFEQIVQQASVVPEPAQSKLDRILHAVHVEQYGVRTQLHRLLESNDDLRRRKQERQGKLRIRIEQTTGQIGRILEEGKAAGAFDTTLSTELMLQTFLHLLSITMQERIDAQEHLTPEEIVAQMSRLFFQGIACPSEKKL